MGFRRQLANSHLPYHAGRKSSSRIGLCSHDRDVLLSAGGVYLFESYFELTRSHQDMPFVGQKVFVFLGKGTVSLSPEVDGRHPSAFYSLLHSRF